MKINKIAAKRMNWFGYSTIGELLITVFGGIKTKLGVITICGASLVSLITGYIYDTPHAVYTLWALYAFDFVTAMIWAWQSGTIASKKMPRVILNTFIITTLLGISWWMSKSMWFFMPLPSVVIGISYSTLFISIIENLTKLNALPKKLIEVVRRRFDTEAVESAIFKDESVK